MSTTPSDAYRAAAAPFDARTTLRTLEITNSDAEIALVTGVYELAMSGATPGVARLGAASTTLPPTSGAAEITGFPLTPGAVHTVFHDATVGDGKLHARLTSAGTETLSITRKP